MDKKSRIRFGFKWKLIVLVSLAVAVAGTVSLVYSYVLTRNQIISDTARMVEIMAATAALQLRGEDVQVLRRKGDYRRPEYRRVYETLKMVYLANADRQFKVNNIYIIRQMPEDPEGRKIYFAAHLPGDSKYPKGLAPLERMADPKVNYMGNDVTYPIMPEMREVVYKGKLSSSTGIYYQAPFGAWISGFAPIKTANGKVQGILEVDYNLNFIQAYLFSEFLKQFAGIAAALVLAIFISLLLANSFSKPVHALSRAADSIASGDYKTRVNLRRSDEFAVLGRHFNQMARVLEEKLHLSKYVSADTLNRVETRDSHGVVSGGRAVMTCFFSDIRGFTSYSEQNEVEDVIQVLNDVLQLQTDIILKHGGSIDKFVGDEVMAVFAGDDGPARAVAAALEIQTVLSRNRPGDSPSVGIGINTGEVIQGDIGSSSRKDFTVIGRAVNLAARLCSAADPGEVIVTEDFQRNLPAEFTATFKEELRLKGIEGSVSLYAISGT